METSKKDTAENKISEVTMRLPEYLRKLRQSYGYTQQYVADYLNVIRQTYSHYETGRIAPSIASLCELSELYRVDPLDMAEIAIKGREPIKHSEIESVEAYHSELLNIADKLSPGQRDALMNLLHEMVD